MLNITTQKTSLDTPVWRRVAPIVGLLGALALPAVSQAATYVVTATADSGAGSLRAAISDANASPGADTITFASGGQGVITLASALPAITDSLAIEGVFGAVTIDGANTYRGFVINGPINVTLSNLVIRNVRAVGSNGGEGMPYGGGGGGGLGAGAGVLVGAGSPTVSIVSTAINNAAVFGGNGGSIPMSGGNTGGNGGDAGFPGSSGGVGGTGSGPASTAGVLGGGGAGGGSGFSPGADGEGGGGGGAGYSSQPAGVSSFLGGAGGAGGMRAGGGGGGGAAGAAVFAFTGSVTFVNSGYSNLSATAGTGGASSSGSPGADGAVGSIPSYAAPGAAITGSFALGPAAPVVEATPVPTLTEWAMILFGAVLAGAAALHLQRRRLIS